MLKVAALHSVSRPESTPRAPLPRGFWVIWTTVALDLVGFGINHPCTTFDKWQVIHVVDDDYNVIESLRTFF